MKEKRKPILIGAASSAFKINPGSVPKDQKKPVLSNKDFSPKFTFSLQYFKQIKYFEIGNLKDSWYVSLIERLQQLSKKEWKNFEKDAVEKQNHRYHAINWSSENVPITRADLNWIDTHYLDNEEDFPMIQFTVSMALGRVVGFWDTDHVFQIVLLDPMHNIQPSKRYSYKVDDTYYMSCQYSSLLIDIIKLKSKIKDDCTCSTCSQLQKLPTNSNNTNMLVAYLDDESIDKIEGNNYQLQDIVELGLLTKEE